MTLNESAKSAAKLAGETIAARLFAKSNGAKTVSFHEDALRELISFAFEIGFETGAKFAANKSEPPPAHLADALNPAAAALKVKP